MVIGRVPVHRLMRGTRLPLRRHLVVAVGRLGGGAYNGAVGASPTNERLMERHMPLLG